MEPPLTIIVVVDRETVEEAWSTPAIWRELAMVEEALEIKPDKFAKPPTFRVEEADTGPETLRFAEKVEEAVESRPEEKVWSAVQVLVTLKLAPVPPVIQAPLTSWKQPEVK